MFQEYCFVVVVVVVVAVVVVNVVVVFTVGQFKSFVIYLIKSQSF